MLDDYNSEEFEKMKHELIKNWFDWDKGWALVPFALAFSYMFKNTNDQERNG